MDDDTPISEEGQQRWLVALARALLQHNTLDEAIAALRQASMTGEAHE